MSDTTKRHIDCGLRLPLPGGEVLLIVHYEGEPLLDVFVATRVSPSEVGFEVISSGEVTGEPALGIETKGGGKI